MHRLIHKRTFNAPPELFGAVRLPAIPSSPMNRAQNGDNQRWTSLGAYPACPANGVAGGFVCWQGASEAAVFEITTARAQRRSQRANPTQPCRLEQFGASGRVIGSVTARSGDALSPIPCHSPQLVPAPTRGRADKLPYLRERRKAWNSHLYLHFQQTQEL
jgi:hypothetical protein